MREILPPKAVKKASLTNVTFAEPDGSLAVMERAYWVVVSMLYESGLRGVAELKTARIAERARTTESTILRHAKTRDGLVEQSIDWCWKVVNDRLAEAAYSAPVVGGDARSTILSDLDHLLSMFDSPTDRVWVTGALLAYRRPNALGGPGTQPERERFVSRIELLSSSFGHGDEAADTDILAAFLVNSVATAWFTWLLKPDLAGAHSLINKGFVLDGIRRYIEEFVSRDSANA